MEGLGREGGKREQEGRVLLKTFNLFHDSS